MSGDVKKTIFFKKTENEIILNLLRRILKKKKKPCCAGLAAICLLGLGLHLGPEVAGPFDEPCLVPVSLSQPPSLVVVSTIPPPASAARHGPVDPIAPPPRPRATPGRRCPRPLPCVERGSIPGPGRFPSLAGKEP